jgi:hypothetical protein
MTTKESQKYFTDEQKNFFKDILKITTENDRKDIIIKILLESTKFYRITVLTELNLSEKFLVKYSPVSKIEYLLSWADWLLNKKRDFVRDYLVENKIVVPSENFFDFEILCFIDDKPVILLRNIENFLSHSGETLLVPGLAQPVSVPPKMVMNDKILQCINSIIYGLEINKIARLVVTTSSDSKISEYFHSMAGWNIRSSYTSNLKWLNELQ